MQNNFDRNIFEEIKGVDLTKDSSIDNVTVGL